MPRAPAYVMYHPRTQQPPILLLPLFQTDTSRQPLHLASHRLSIALCDLNRTSQSAQRILPIKQHVAELVLQKRFLPLNNWRFKITAPRCGSDDDEQRMLYILRRTQPYFRQSRTVRVILDGNQVAKHCFPLPLIGNDGYTAPH